MRNRSGFYEIELSEEILINQLVRKGIEIKQFFIWYYDLNVEKQTALISSLFEYAYQSGFDDFIVNVALEQSNLQKYDNFIQRILKLGFDIDAIEDWCLNLDLNEREIVFKFSVFLFGIAENNVYFNICLKEKNCNHWWHRNLMDDTVVKSILNNPEYYLSSRKDDQ